MDHTLLVFASSSHIMDRVVTHPNYVLELILEIVWIEVSVPVGARLIVIITA